MQQMLTLILPDLQLSAVAVDVLKQKSDVIEVGFSGKLHERELLAARLNLTNSIPSDPELVSLAYQCWGLDLVKYLSGDFCFVLLDRQKQRVIGARDALGARSLFYVRNGAQLIVSARLACLLEHSSIERRLNHRKLAVNALVWQDGSAETFYDGILALSAGCILTFDAKGVETRVYWTPDAEQSLDLPDADVPHALRDLLFKAVAARLPVNCKAAALLSGGLDSSAIVAVAATLLKEKNQQLLALSAVVPQYLQGKIVDERPFIHAFSDFKNIEFLEITDEWRGPFDQIMHTEYVVAPFRAANYYQHTAFTEVAALRGISEILDGNFGEYGPTYAAPEFYVEQFLNGHWLNLSRELLMRASVTRTPFWQLLKSTIAGPLAPRWLKRITGRPSAVRSKIWTENHPLQISYLEKHLKESQEALEDRIFAAKHSGFCTRANQANQIASFQKTHGLSGLSQSDVLFCHPLLDKHVIEFCLAAPAHLKVKNGYPRSLVRNALDGLLPPSIQWRTSKEPFAPDFHLRYNRQRPIAEEFLASIAPNDPIREVVDVARLQIMVKHEMHGNRDDTSPNFIAMHMVTRGVYLIHFLRQFSEFSVP